MAFTEAFLMDFLVDFGGGVHRRPGGSPGRSYTLTLLLGSLGGVMLGSHSTGQVTGMHLWWLRGLRWKISTFEPSSSFGTFPDGSIGGARP